MLSSFSYGDALYVGTSRLDLKKGTSYELTSGGLQGVHATQLSASGKYLIDSYSAPDVPREISIIDGQKRETLRTLLTAKIRTKVMRCRKSLPEKSRRQMVSPI